MLKKLGDIVTGDNTNRNVAGSNHFEGCLVVSFAKNAFDLWRKQQGGRSFWLDASAASTKVHSTWESVYF